MVRTNGRRREAAGGAGGRSGRAHRVSVQPKDTAIILVTNIFGKLGEDMGNTEIHEDENISDANKENEDN
ncbi:unnamed protein product [Arabis nemorensis]|uniref:Uncharacterized protein n=1 Tax=Arabis nemorensis TaxID=586526 RepID=A0A565BTJ3_9BRAS|nr:unnamed protein product [Arabis nemorensis]